MSAFHPGEVHLQEKVGAAQRLAAVASRAIRDHMPQQHRDFFAQLPFLVVGTVDAAGWPHAGLVAGAPGFAHSPDERTLRIDAAPLAGDPSRAGWIAGSPVGVLGIEPHTRRRNRMNGRLVEVDARGARIVVDQSFGNCPKYIVARRAAFRDKGVPASFEEGVGLDADAQALLRRADMLFIATAHPRAGEGDSASHGVDVSHRGGRPGFLRVERNVVTLPDYAGNQFFNTLGNLLLEPRCGLLVPDFARGGALWLSARAKLVHDGAQVAAFPGALRLVRLEVERFTRVKHGIALDWEDGPAAPEFDAQDA